MKYIKLTSFILAVMLISGSRNTAVAAADEIRREPWPENMLTIIKGMEGLEKIDLLNEVYEMRYAETTWVAES